MLIFLKSGLPDVMSKYEVYENYKSLIDIFYIFKDPIKHSHYHNKVYLEIICCTCIISKFTLLW